MNVFTAIGRIGRDGEVRFTQGGKPVLGFALAVDAGYGQNKTTTWWDCSVWGERAEKLAEYIRKGEQVGVTGEVSTREYESKGATKTALCLRVSEVTLLAKAQGNRPAQQPRQEQQAPREEAFPDDDIPF